MERFRLLKAGGYGTDEGHDGKRDSATSGLSLCYKRQPMKLSAKDVELIQLLADPSDNRTKEEKCTSVGYHPKQVYRLQRKPEAQALYSQLVRENTHGNLGTIYAALLRKASEGDVKACEVYLKAMGEIQSGVNVTTNVTQTTNGEFREAIRKAQEARMARLERAKRFAHAGDE